MSKSQVRATHHCLDILIHANSVLIAKQTKTDLGHKSLWNGRVVSIHIAPKAYEPTKFMSEVRAVAGKGLEGDRYFNHLGFYSDKPGPDREITLIEIETINALQRELNMNIDPGEFRRNVVTRGVPLNHLVGREFAVGSVILRGIRLCEPCAHLEELTKEGVLRGLIHRGGLRAQITVGGTIRVGEQIQER